MRPIASFSMRSCLLASLLAGCVGGPAWVNPALPKERWDADLAGCRREAEDMLGPGAYVEPGEDRSGNPMKLVDRTQNAKKFETLVGQCMMAQGYRPAK